MLVLSMVHLACLHRTRSATVKNKHCKIIHNQLPFAEENYHNAVRMQISKHILCRKLMLTIMLSKSKHTLCHKPKLHATCGAKPICRKNFFHRLCCYYFLQGLLHSKLPSPQEQEIHLLSSRTVCTTVDSVSSSRGAASIKRELAVWCRVLFHNNTAPKVTIANKAVPMTIWVPITRTIPTGPSVWASSSVKVENMAMDFDPAAHVCVFSGGWQEPVHLQPSQHVLPVLPPQGWKAALQPRLN